jgi:hypothetical protein
MTGELVGESPPDLLSFAPSVVSMLDELPCNRNGLDLDPPMVTT